MPLSRAVGISTVPVAFSTKSDSPGAGNAISALARPLVNRDTPGRPPEETLVAAMRYLPPSRPAQ